MDYELMMNGNIKIGQKAPTFNAISTNGNEMLDDYNGKWLVLFSYSGDFTNLSEIELIELSRNFDFFKQLNTEILAISMDSLDVHNAWIKDIYMKTGIEILFPIIADVNGEISRQYGMISKDISNIKTTRNVVLINPNGIINTIFEYPLNIKRNINEIIRVIYELENLNKKFEMNKKMK